MSSQKLVCCRLLYSFYSGDGYTTYSIETRNDNDYKNLVRTCLSKTLNPSNVFNEDSFALHSSRFEILNPEGLILLKKKINH